MTERILAECVFNGDACNSFKIMYFITLLCKAQIDSSVKPAEHVILAECVQPTAVLILFNGDICNRKYVINYFIM